MVLWPSAISMSNADSCCKLLQVQDEPPTQEATLTMAVITVHRRLQSVRRSVCRNGLRVLSQARPPLSRAVNAGFMFTAVAILLHESVLQPNLISNIQGMQKDSMMQSQAGQPPASGAPHHHIQSLGCFQDEQRAALGGKGWALPMYTFAPGMSLEACAQHAATSGFTVFALEHGQTCWYGDDDLATATRYGSLPSAACDKLCPFIVDSKQSSSRTSEGFGGSCAGSGEGPIAMSMYRITPVSPSLAAAAEARISAAARAINAQQECAAATSTMHRNVGHAASVKKLVRWPLWAAFATSGGSRHNSVGSTTGDSNAFRSVAGSGHATRAVASALHRIMFSMPREQVLYNSWAQSEGRPLVLSRWRGYLAFARCSGVAIMDGLSPYALGRIYQYWRHTM